MPIQKQLSDFFTSPSLPAQEYLYSDDEFPTDPAEVDLTQDCDELEDELTEMNTQPAPNTQASQTRLLANRDMLGRRYARYQLSVYSGKVQSRYDAKWDPKSTDDELKAALLRCLRKIPDAIWRSSSRANVRASKEKSHLQMCLGLVKTASWRGVPMPSKKTFEFLELTKLILELMRRLAKKRSLALAGSSIQINKNHQSAPHVDGNNSGPSFMLGQGCWTGGQLFVEDSSGDFVIELPADVKKIGKPGQKVVGSLLNIRDDTIVEFDGTRIHATFPFQGERYSMIMFTMGTESYHETPDEVRVFLSTLGFPLTNDTPPISKEREMLICHAATGQPVHDQPGRHIPPGGGAKRAKRARSNKGRRSEGDTDSTNARPEAQRKRRAEGSKGVRGESSSSGFANDVSQPHGTAWTPWTQADVEKLQELAGAKRPFKRFKAVAAKMGKTEQEVRQHWLEMSKQQLRKSFSASFRN